MEETEDFIVLNGGRDQRPNPHLASWLSGWPRRELILARVRHLLEAPVSEDPVAGFDRAAGPALALLRLGRRGIDLEDDGSFTRHVREEMRVREPDWGSRQPRAALDHLYGTLARGHLMKRRHLRVVTCSDAIPFLDGDPDVLINMAACWLVSREGFDTDVAELGAASLLAGANFDPVALSIRAYPAIAEYWTSCGVSITLDEVHHAMRRWLAFASATGVIPDLWAEDLRSDGDGWPRPVGPVARTCLTTMLRYRSVRHIPRRPPPG